jgi:hypothetical protein
LQLIQRLFRDMAAATAKFALDWLLAGYHGMVVYDALILPFRGKPDECNP